MTILNKNISFRFFPISQTIAVINKPIFDVTFSQLKATVDGEVKCLNGKNCDSLRVYLIPTYNDNSDKELSSIVESKLSNIDFIFDLI